MLENNSVLHSPGGFGLERMMQDVVWYEYRCWFTFWLSHGVKMVLYLLLLNDIERGWMAAWQNMAKIIFCQSMFHLPPNLLVTAAQEESDVAFWTIWKDDIDDWHMSSWSQRGMQMGDCLLPAEGGPWHIQDNFFAGASLCGSTEKWQCADFMAHNASQPIGLVRTVPETDDPGSSAKKAVPFIPKSGSMLPKTLTPPPKRHEPSKSTRTFAVKPHYFRYL